MTHSLSHTSLVGSIPQPIGGVTQHVWRLALRLTPTGCTVLDRHPAPQKYPVPGAELRIGPQNRYLKIAWLINELRRSSPQVAHFHFSTTRVLSTLRHMMRTGARHHHKVLTLHHGDLAMYHNMLRERTRRQANSMLQAFDCIICLSAKQREFYEQTVGIDESRLISASSHISIPKSMINELSTGTSAQLRVPQAEAQLIAAGFPDDIYNHQDSIRLVDRLRNELDARLTLCLYGRKNAHPLLPVLQELASTRAHVDVHWNLDFSEFLCLLKQSDLYIRPTLADSYGIAVADAISCDVPAVASDVCRRHAAAITFPTGDFEAFEATVRETLQNLPRIRQQLSVAPDDDSFAATSTAYQRDLLQKCA